MPGRCLVTGCPSSRRKFDRWRKGPCPVNGPSGHGTNCGCPAPFNMHLFPSPHVQQGLIRSIWSELVFGSAEAATKSHMHVCSVHMRQGSINKLPTVNVGKTEAQVRNILTKYGIDADHELKLPPVVELQSYASATCNVLSGASVQIDPMTFMAGQTNESAISGIDINDDDNCQEDEEDGNFTIVEKLCEQIRKLCSKCSVEFCLYIAPNDDDSVLYRHSSVQPVDNFFHMVQQRETIDISAGLSDQKYCSAEATTPLACTENVQHTIEQENWSSSFLDGLKSEVIQEENELDRSAEIEQPSRKRFKPMKQPNLMGDFELNTSEIVEYLKKMSAMYDMDIGMILAPVDKSQPVLQYSTVGSFQRFMTTVKDRQCQDIQHISQEIT